MKKILLVLSGFLLWAGFLEAAPPGELLPAGTVNTTLLVPTGPLGEDWTQPTFDDGSWSYAEPPVGYDAPPPPTTAYANADSFLDFSGTQGQRNWFYGYWNKTADPDGTYQTWDFTPFPREEGNTTLGPNNFWDGGAWNYYPHGDAPGAWTGIWQGGGHPNGAATTPPNTHYAIRRWLSSQAGQVTMAGTIHQDPGSDCGDGVDLHIFVDGVEVYSAVAYRTSVPFSVNASVEAGAVVDFAIGPGAAQNSWCDGHDFRVAINYRTQSNTIADSMADWSFAGEQGYKGWYYGYYDRTADLANAGDGVYQPSEFNYQDPNWTFNGTWTLGPGDPPWTTVGQDWMHPNTGGDSEQWAVRRWISTYTGKALVYGILGKPNYCGDVRGHIFLDGAEIMNRWADGLTMAYAVVADLTAGSTLDFALDPNGNDGCDATTWTVTIQPTADGTTLVADSIVDFSGIQGFNDWHYGYYSPTTDPDGIYQSGDFNENDPFWTFTDGVWQLGGLTNDINAPFDPRANPPWTTLSEQTWHPNSWNSSYLHPDGTTYAEEHWTTRRWVSPVSGALSICYHFAKENGNCGGGTTLQIFQNGTPKDSLTVSGGDRTGATHILDLVVAAGDFLDFALKPLGLDGGTDDGCDSSVFNAYIFHNPISPAIQWNLLTDSAAAWGSGAQGENGWYYGYYNHTDDPNQVYDPDTDLITAGQDPDWQLIGGGWRFASQPPCYDGCTPPCCTGPWSTIGQTFWHPNGVNSAPNKEFWSIRRWYSNTDGDLRLDWFLGKAPGNPWGNGVSGYVFHNGVLKSALTIAGDDTSGHTSTALLPGVVAGDRIDFALSPVGAHDANDDGSDGSVGWARIYSIASGASSSPPDLAAQMYGKNTSVYLRGGFWGFSFATSLDCVGKLLLGVNYKDGFVAYLNGQEVARRNGPRQYVGAHPASSVSDWSPAGVQGNNGWFYGRYNMTADPDHTYQVPDFDTTSDGWYWNGGAWQLPRPPCVQPDGSDCAGPWDTIGQTDWHPNGDNWGHVDYVIRRWVSSVEGDVVANLQLRKTNPNCGNGVTGHLFHNGAEVFRQTIACNDTAGFNVNVPVSGVRVGDTLDFALDPLGTDGAYNDGSDGSYGTMDVRQEYAPMTLAWNSQASASRPMDQAQVEEVIDISAFKGLLLDQGWNVLAIQGLTSSLDESQFSLSARLLYAEPPPVGPANIDVLVGQSGAFFVTSPNCTPPTYQWRKGPDDIPGATDPTLSVGPVVWPDDNNTTYSVVVDYVGGQVTNSALLTVDRPPVANDFTVGGIVDVPVWFSADLLPMVASDPDGDPVQLSGFSTPTTQDGSVAMSPPYLVYTPPPAYGGNDDFTYTIWDGRVGSASGKVTISLAPPAYPFNTMLPLAPVPGGYKVSFSGIPGAFYIIQRSTDVTSGTWDTITPTPIMASLLSAPIGVIEYDDTAVPPNQAFYRVVRVQ